MFKILIFTSLSLSLIGFLFSGIKRPHWMNFLSGLTVFLIVIHLIFVKYQWQMIPIYILASILFIISIISIIRIKRIKIEILKEDHINKIGS